MGINPCKKSQKKGNESTNNISANDLSNSQINHNNLMNNSLTNANNIETSTKHNINKSNIKTTIVDNNTANYFSKDKDNISQAENYNNLKPELINKEQDIDKNQSNNPPIKGSNQTSPGLKVNFNSDILLNLEKCKLYNELIKLKNKVQELNKYYIDKIQSHKLEQIKYYNKNLKLNNELTQIKQFKNVNENLNEKITKFNGKISLLETQILNLETENKNLKQEREYLINENESLRKEIEDIIARPPPPQNEPILVGLDNIGATCYMNATLQSLSNTSKLSDYFLKKGGQIDKKKKISYEYSKVVKNLWNIKNNHKSYAPHSFKKVISEENPLFEGINANDSKDLINFLIERFHQELNNLEANNMQINNVIINQQDQLDEKKMLKLFFNDFKNKYHSIISDLFYGIMETKSQCQGCGNFKFNFQVYSFLEFPLEQVNNFYFNKGMKIISNNNINPDVNLIECFNYYQKVDLMNGDNQMYCNICNRNCDAFYSTNLYSLPNILIINLNRGKGAIYQCKVNFPEKLNLLNFVNFQEDNTYFELYAVISHLGPSSMSGHFIAYCKNKIDKKWYIFNDSIVQPCTKKGEYNNGMPYILFYQAV